MERTSILALCLCLTPAAAAQAPESHAESGAFKQPTPADRYRQDASLDNLVHPPGYRTAAADSFAEVVERGSGDVPVILLAGLGPSWRIFESFLATEQESYRFFCVTLPGYGGSSALPMPAKGTSYGEGPWLKSGRNALKGLIEERELERPIVLAFYSDASRIALRAALEEPDRFGGVLVLSASARFPLPPGTPRADGMDGFAEKWFKTVTPIMWPSGMWPTEFYANDPALAEKTWWDVLQPSLPTAIRYTVETWADDLVPDLTGLKVPTAVLSPGFDEQQMESPRGEMIRQRFHVPWEEAVEAGSPLVHTVVAGARLLIWEDQPAAVRQALAGLAQEVSATK